MTWILDDTEASTISSGVPEEIPTWLIIGSVVALSLITVMLVRR